MALKWFNFPSKPLLQNLSLHCHNHYIMFVFLGTINARCTGFNRKWHLCPYSTQATLSSIYLSSGFSSPLPKSPAKQPVVAVIGGRPRRQLRAKRVCVRAGGVRSHAPSEHTSGQAVCASMQWVYIHALSKRVSGQGARVARPGPTTGVARMVGSRLGVSSSRGYQTRTHLAIHRLVAPDPTINKYPRSRFGLNTVDMSQVTYLAHFKYPCVSVCVLVLQNLYPGCILHIALTTNFPNFDCNLFH